MLVPVDATHDMLDIATGLHLPVLLVVGIRLGCLNHALLAALALRSRGLRLSGWVANHVDPHLRAKDSNVEALALRLQAPLLAEIPWNGTPALPLQVLEILRVGHFERRQDRVQPFRPDVGSGNLEGHAGLCDLALGAHEALRNCRFGHKESSSDL